MPKDKERTNILIIENRFKDADLFYKSVIANDHDWSTVLFVKTRLQVLLICLFKYRPARLYYYLDWLLVPALMLYFIPCKNIYIYEEGIGSYRTDIFKNLARYKRKIRELFGVYEYPGFHPRVKGMYVYCKEYYLKKLAPYSKHKTLNAFSFNMSFPNMLENNKELAKELFQFNIQRAFPHLKNKRLVLYITSWPLNESFFDVVNLEEYDYCIIKPHPHITDVDSFNKWKNDCTIIINSIILSEFLIKQLLDENNTLDIYHCSSTALLYLSEHPNIRKVINLTHGLIEFDQIFNGIRSECEHSDIPAS
ncbi:alpha-2,8-polysialyltransferase family protein [Chitinophaga sp. GbtcB8]|uniref:alpha-2,8-polysialyltransferase family protein n=1 Tax=Chitinophaga sp. GbtcB8 TaxID=2824753 RepID=UPI001C2F537D|nr:alpha-2,8-polysialyltransferase family protein [Chitinophaga sp. GbtcB8]